MFACVQRVPEIPASIAAIQIQPLIAALERIGQPTARVLAHAGLSPADIADPYARIPGSAEFALWDAILQVTGDPLIAIVLAEQIEIGALGAYEYLLRNSPTMRAALERASRFERVVDDLTRIELIEQGERAAIRLVREGGYAHPPLGVQCLFAVLVKIGVREIGPFAAELRFRHKAPADPALFTQRLQHEVRFEQEYDEVVFARALVDAKMRSADPRLGEVLEEHMQRLLNTLPAQDPFVVRARGQLRPLLEAGGASLEALAAALHVGARTLRRRLQEHGTSYKALLEDVRHELARHYVGETREPFEEVARRLGFSEPSTFYRAFKRWAGTTPALYRARRP